jgi:hypothetical protein
VLAALLLWANRHELAGSSLNSLRWQTAVLAWLTLMVVTTGHEFAHGLTCPGTHIGDPDLTASPEPPGVSCEHETRARVCADGGRPRARPAHWHVAFHLLASTPARNLGLTARSCAAAAKKRRPAE